MQIGNIDKISHSLLRSEAAQFLVGQLYDDHIFFAEFRSASLGILLFWHHDTYEHATAMLDLNNAHVLFNTAPTSGQRYT